MSDRAERLSSDAFPMDAQARAAFIDAQCAGQDDLRDEVLALLAEADAADVFFDRLDEAVFSPSPSGDDDFDADLPELEFLPGESVGHYRIESLIGRGGMGAVFRARDVRLNRDVALKFLPAHLSADPDEQARLLAEARAAAVLDHPNVCTVHEVGETEDGRLFIAMPSYGGETLKEKLRAGPLPAAEAAAIAAQIARGLAAAHSREIIHRDVKPGNVILLPDGSVRLLDFGLAMEINARLMSSGTTPGTVAYMSPEQIRGEPLNSSTDLWSLGVVLYQMLAGERPFTGKDRRAVINAIVNGERDPVTRRCPSLDPALALVVERLLEKDPSMRYASASDVASDLEAMLRPHSDLPKVSFMRKHSGLVAAGVVTALAVAAGLFWRGSQDTAAFQSTAQRAQPSLAVMPLTNLDSDSSDAALANGITEDLIAILSNAGDIRVIASTSVASLKRLNMDARQIADSLHVGNVLEGGIQRVDGKLRVQIRLVDGRDGTTRWSQSYDRGFNEMFAVQDEIVRAVAAELDLRFDRDKQFVRHRTRNIEAYEVYLRASDPVLLRSQTGIWKSQDLYLKALALDPDYAAAHAGLALVYVRRARNASDPGMPVPKLLELADNEALKAIALDSSLAEGHYARGRVREAMLDFPVAEGALRRAILLDPSRSVYRRALSYLNAWTARPGEELAEAQRALETDPLNPYAIAAVASGLYGSHRYDEAIAQLEPLMSLKPPLQGVTFAIAQCYAKKGMWDKAIALLRPGAEAGDPLFRALLGNMLARTGKRDEANRILADLMARRESTGIGAFHIAMIHAGFGNRDETFAWLDKSIDDRSIVSFIMGPTFEDLHSDPRFSQLRTRLGLSDTIEE
jgi:serine/threonine protein kinase/tetratricopeptide (TPR) repeat protein